MTEEDAWILHRKGVTYASEWLVTRFAPLAKSIAHKMNTNRAAFGVFDADDYHATAMLGLWEAISRYDGRCAFSTYAVPVIRGRVIDQLRAVSSGSRNGEHKIHYAEMPEPDEIGYEAFDIVNVIATRELEKKILDVSKQKSAPPSRRKCPACGSIEYLNKIRRYLVEGTEKRKVMSFFLCNSCGRDSRDYDKKGKEKNRKIYQRVFQREEDHLIQYTRARMKTMRPRGEAAHRSSAR